MPTDHYVIIGNGPAGNKAAVTLRQHSKDARITILSDETHPYYYKPKLTGFIAGDVSESDLIVKPDTFYEELNIRVRLGQKVEKIDVETNTLFLTHKETISYSKLIIASGSSARLLPAMEGYADHLNFVTSYTDVLAYKDQIEQCNDFFIFGGDLVGFKFIRLLKSMDKNITVLVYPNAFWPHNLDREMLSGVWHNLNKLDVNILIRDDISTIQPGDNSRLVITTAKGFDIKADMVFSFNGLIPNIDFIKGAGIDYDHGILVDEYLKSSNDNVYACGSCAQIYNPQIKNYSTTIGWPNAVNQGEVAALNLLGNHQGVESAGRKYFDMGGVKIKTTWWEDIED